MGRTVIEKVLGYIPTLVMQCEGHSVPGDEVLMPRLIKTDVADKNGDAQSLTRAQEVAQVVYDPVLRQMFKTMSDQYEVKSEAGFKVRRVKKSKLVELFMMVLKRVA